MKPNPSVRKVYPFALRTSLGPVFTVPIGFPSRTWARDRYSWGCKTLSLRGGSGLFPRHLSLTHGAPRAHQESELPPEISERAVYTTAISACARAAVWVSYPGGSTASFHYPSQRGLELRKEAKRSQSRLQSQNPDLHPTGLWACSRSCQPESVRRRLPDQESRSPTPWSDSGYAHLPHEAMRNQPGAWKTEFSGRRTSHTPPDRAVFQTPPAENDQAQELDHCVRPALVL